MCLAYIRPWAINSCHHSKYTKVLLLVLVLSCCPGLNGVGVGVVDVHCHAWLQFSYCPSLQHFSGNYHLTLVLISQLGLWNRHSFDTPCWWSKQSTFLLCVIIACSIGLREALMFQVPTMFVSPQSAHSQKHLMIIFQNVSMLASDFGNTVETWLPS